MKLATISSKNQITLPVDILRSLGLKQGSKVLIKKEEKDVQKYIAITPIVGNIADHYLGFGKKTFQKLGNGEKFLKKLRTEWK